MARRLLVQLTLNVNKTKLEGWTLSDTSADH